MAYGRSTSGSGSNAPKAASAALSTWKWSLKVLRPSILCKPCFIPPFGRRAPGTNRRHRWPLASRVSPPRLDIARNPALPCPGCFFACKKVCNAGRIVGNSTVTIYLRSVVPLLEERGHEFTTVRSKYMCSIFTTFACTNLDARENDVPISVSLNLKALRSLSSALIYH